MIVEREWRLVGQLAVAVKNALLVNHPLIVDDAISLACLRIPACDLRVVGVDARLPQVPT